jgi:hypothetical protein
MQNRNFGLRGITLAVASAMTLGLAACEDVEVVTPVQAPAIQISPTGTVELNAGETFQVAATTQNATSVAFTSSNPSVATVTGNGVVTAVDPGIASIIATATGENGQTAQAAVTVRVLEAAVVEPVGEASVSIVSVVDEDNVPVDLAAVQADVFARINFERGNATRLVVRLGEEQVCVQDFAAATTKAAAQGMSASQAAQADFLCPIDTDRFDTATGAVRFRNAQLPLVAQLIGPNGAVLETARVTVNLTNQDRFALRVSTTEGSAIGPDGLLFTDGSVVVRALPVIFTANTSIARATVDLVAAANAQPALNADIAAQTVELVDGAFTVTFPENVLPSRGGVQGITAALTPVITSSVTAAGAVGPNRIGAVTVAEGEDEILDVADNGARFFRLDNQAPVLPTLALPAARQLGTGGGFVGANFDFNTVATFDRTAAGFPDFQGVDQVTTRFFVGNAPIDATTLTADNIATTLTEVRTGADFTAAVTSPTGREVVALVCDALLNCRIVDANVQFGVDLVAPRITDVTVLNANELRNVFNSSIPDAFGLGIEEDVSGFGANPVQAQSFRIIPSGRVCGPDFGTDEDLPGALVNGNCVFTATGTQIELPPLSAEGYYTYTIRAVDVAGNVSETVTRTILVDDPAPVVTNINFPATINAGQAATFTGFFSDNLDLFRAVGFERFTVDGGTLDLAFENFQQIDERFDLADANTFVRDAQISTTTSPFIGALFSGSAGALTQNNVQAFGFDVRDAALNVAIGERPITQNFNITNPFTGITGFSLTADDVTVTQNQAVTLTAQIQGGQTLENPFAQVLFFRREMHSGVPFGRLVGSTTAATITTTVQNERAFRFNFVTTPAADIAVDGQSTFFAVGVTSNGAALLFPNVTFTRVAQ